MVYAHHKPYELMQRNTITRLQAGTLNNGSDTLASTRWYVVPHLECWLAQPLSKHYYCYGILTTHLWDCWPAGECLDALPDVWIRQHVAAAILEVCVLHACVGCRRDRRHGEP